MNGSHSNLEFRKIKSLNFLYEVNENGTVFRNVKSKKQLKIKLDFHHAKAGYYTTFVHIGGRKNSRTIRVPIHRVVAECWLGECPDGYEVDHIDRNPHNNDYRNLRYVTKNKQLRKKPVLISRCGEQSGVSYQFDSYAECSRFLSNLYGCTFDSVRQRLKAHRSHIRDFHVIYLNAETVHSSSTEQETVHEK